MKFLSRLAGKMMPGTENDRPIWAGKADANGYSRVFAGARFTGKLVKCAPRGMGLNGR